MQCNGCEDWNGQTMQCTRFHKWWWQCELPANAATSRVAASTMAAAGATGGASAVMSSQSAPEWAVCGSLRKRRCRRNSACEWHGARKKADRHCMPKLEEAAAASSRAVARSMDGVVPSPSYRGAEPLAAQWNIGLAACASLKRHECKKSQACAWDRPARQCVAEEPEVTAAKPSVHQMRCTIAGPCLSCSAEERAKDPVSCGKTGSRQRLECTGGEGNFQSCYADDAPGAARGPRGMPLHVFELIVLLVLSVSLLTVFGKKTGRI